MEIKSINYFGDDGWENFTDYNYTPSAQLHIPRVGDTIKNSYGEFYTVEEVVWLLASNAVMIRCKKNGK